MRAIDEPPLPDDLDVRVSRSRLDSRVWYPDVVAREISEGENAGTLRAVQAWCVAMFATGHRVHWEREDPDTWRMRLVEE